MRRPTLAITPYEQRALEAAHDFNNLLTAIIGAVSAVLERSSIDADIRAELINIREGAARGTVLARRLQSRTYNRPERPGLVSINKTICSTSHLLAHRLGATITLILDLDETEGQVRFESSQLDRVLLNLIANARHAMADEGIVILKTRHRTIVTAEQRFPDRIPAGDYVLITVADTGTGITRERMLKIFDLGFSSRRHRGGFGLGLSSVRDVIGRCSGYLAVMSVAGRGATFEVYLPQEDSEMPRSIQMDGSNSLDGRVVLLVDDDWLVREVTERILRGAGWNVVKAGSGEDALQRLNDISYDLIISDVAMPGMDGLRLVRLVQASHPDLPVILSSGYELDVNDAVFGTTNVMFLSKPYTQSDLLGAVARITRDRAD
jgi:two-component system cell cycle sensor histidine kinase/response regulator CckA